MEHQRRLGRQFGIDATPNPAKVATFYTRGVDRATGPLDAIIANKLIFPGADALWKNVMDKVAKTINAMGGKASVDDPTGVHSKQINYSKNVPATDQKKVTSSGN